MYPVYKDQGEKTYDTAISYSRRDDFYNGRVHACRMSPEYFYKYNTIYLVSSPVENRIPLDLANEHTGQ